MAAAISVAPSNRVDRQGSEWFYELQPLDELPVLDLSLRSRFMSRQALNRTDYCIQQRKLVDILALAGNVNCLVTLLALRSIDRVTALLMLISACPVMLVGLSSLRYEVISLLMWTYDF